MLVSRVSAGDMRSHAMARRPSNDMARAVAPFALNLTLRMDS
jgi:hypothetical protein